MASAKATGERRRLEPAEYRPGASTEANCRICGDCQPLRNSYGVDACASCNNFFHNTVNDMIFTMCDIDGMCPITVATKFDCRFCWMSKCFESGMMTNCVKMRDDYIQRRYNRMHPRLPTNLQPFLSEKASAFKRCLLYMEQHYYQWLHLSNNYNSLSYMDRELVRNRSYIRGTALQLVERSLVAHDVLWLHICFFDPYASEIPAIRKAASAILNFTIDCRAASINVEQFVKLKVKLALKDDVSVPGENAIPRAVYQMMDSVEGKMIDGLIEGVFSLQKLENPSYISNSKLFRYNVMNPEICFPAHTIHVIPDY